MTGASIYVGRDHIDKRMEDKLLASIPDYRQVVCLPVTFAFEVFEYFRFFTSLVWDMTPLRTL